jgi:hypothetical protein
MSRKQKTPTKVPVKVFLVPSELRLLRLAAASRNVTPTAFLKQAGLVAAAKEMEGFTPPRLESSPSKVRTKKNV